MQYFPLLYFQHLVLAFFLGTGFVILLYIAFSSYKQTREEMSEEGMTSLRGVSWPKRTTPKETVSPRFSFSSMWASSCGPFPISWSSGIKGTAF